MMLSWSQDQDKKIGTIFGQIDPQEPSGLNFKVFAKKFDVACSFVFFFFIEANTFFFDLIVNSYFFEVKKNPNQFLTALPRSIFFK